MLVVQRDHDNCQPAERGHLVAELTGAGHVELAGAGHVPMARDRVLVDRLIHGSPPASTALARRRTWARAARSTAARAAGVVSVGLGHAWRDVAIARELRSRVPGLEVHWLAQAPVTPLLEACRQDRPSRGAASRPRPPA